MHIFLQGRSGIGKSSLLKEALELYIAEISGFVVQRLTEGGQTIGFRAAPLENGFPPLTAEYTPGLGGVFIIRGRYDIIVLEETILRVEGESLKTGCKLLLMDEIGGIELASRVFMASLERILSGNKPCAGVFKSRDNLARASRNLDLGREYGALHRELEARLYERGELLTVNEWNYSEIHDYLTDWIRRVK